MNKMLFFTFCLLSASTWSRMVVAAENSDIYRLHQGDTVSVSVWRQDTLQKQVIVLPDGSITLPLIGRVEVAGLSTPEVEQRITTKLKVSRIPLSQLWLPGLTEIVLTSWER